MNNPIARLVSVITVCALLIGCTSQQDSRKRLQQIVNNTNETIVKIKEKKQTPRWDEYCIWDSCAISNNCVYFYVHMQPIDESFYAEKSDETRKKKFLFDIIYSDELWQQMQWFKDANVGLALSITNTSISDVIVTPEEVAAWNFNDKVGNAVNFLSSLVEEENQKLSSSKDDCVGISYDRTTVVYTYLCEDSIVEEKINNQENFKEELETNYNYQRQHSTSIYSNSSFDIENLKRHANANSMYIYKSKDSDKTFSYKVSAFGKLLECDSK